MEGTGGQAASGTHAAGGIYAASGTHAAGGIYAEAAIHPRRSGAYCVGCPPKDLNNHPCPTPQPIDFTRPACSLMGARHCFIFPSMFDLSASSLPGQYRGTGTALILGAGDVGMLIGFTTVGEVIDRFGYGAAICGLAGVLFVVSVAVAIRRREHVFGQRGLSASAT